MSVWVGVFENGTHGLLLGSVEGGVEEEDARGARQAVGAVPDGAAPAQAAAQRHCRQRPEKPSHFMHNTHMNFLSHQWWSNMEKNQLS